jgi:hypothetical protein
MRSVSKLQFSGQLTLTLYFEMLSTAQRGNRNLEINLNDTSFPKNPLFQISGGMLHFRRNLANFRSLHFGSFSL